jgi:hypothetical protein
VTLTNSSFISNTHAYGAAIMFRGNSEVMGLLIAESNFTQNEAIFGGAIYIQPSTKIFDIVVISSEFNGNIAYALNEYGGLGGAAYLSFFGDIKAVRC